MLNRLKSFSSEQKVTHRAGRFLKVLFREGWPFWVTVLGFGVAWLVAILLSDRGEDTISYAGLLLQLFGVSVVAFGLSKTRRLFGRPSVRERFKGWLRGLRGALRKPEPASVTAGTASADAEVYPPRIIQRPGSDATLEERIGALEKGQRELREAVKEVRKSLTGGLSDVGQSISEESKERQQQAVKLRSQLEEFSVGGLSLESVGLLWLIVGIILSSLPHELASLF